MDYRSLTAGGTHRAEQLTREVLPTLLEAHAVKYLWFLQHKYRPHIWQALFHSAQHDGLLTRFRHLVAGRRGGKTLSAAWETLFYALHPREFHRDRHGVESDRPLWVWALAKDHKLGGPSLITFMDVIRQAGLVKNQDYVYNKTEKVFEFYGPGEQLLARVEFKTAVDPQSLRGAGLDILWIDESAFISTQEAWDVVFPALADKDGMVITTTTPNGKNWFWKLFWSDRARLDPNQFRVEYTSIDNPYFKRSQWNYALEHYHPWMFRQEFMAAFDAMAGVALQGDWLKWWVAGNPDIQTDDVGLPFLQTDTGPRYDLQLFLGIDPAISLADTADHFAMALIGITRQGDQAFLIDYYVDRIQFPDQLDKIREWQLKWRPQNIGIESNAYQRALMQMTARMEGLPPVITRSARSGSTASTRSSSTSGCRTTPRRRTGTTTSRTRLRSRSARLEFCSRTRRTRTSSPATRKRTRWRSRPGCRSSTPRTRTDPSIPRWAQRSNAVTGEPLAARSGCDPGRRGFDSRPSPTKGRAWLSTHISRTTSTSGQVALHTPCPALSQRSPRHPFPCSASLNWSASVMSPATNWSSPRASSRSSRRRNARPRPQEHR